VTESYDLLVIGGGINGAGVARDAAGRGLDVLLVEKDDLAAATSSWSSKLIHGGLRYLELYEFRLVSEALAEREVLLRVAGHLVSPTRFVMPHVPGLRPRWMIMLGLFLYDHLARRSTLPGSQAVRFDAPPYGVGMKAGIKHGFAYSDCRVDDARLVLVNALSARDHGAVVRTRTECVAARRREGLWRVQLRSSDGTLSHISARAIVDAAGPWVKQVLDERLARPGPEAVRLVKGSHIVLPSLYPGEHAYILQNTDGRVVFMIPFEEHFTLVGTTDVPVDDPSKAEASREEVEYLCRAVSRYLARPATPADVVWRYAGVRPLYDDGASDPSAVTRDYTLRVDDEGGRTPVVAVYGGKITTYRRLAERVLDKLAPYFPSLKGPWTANAPLPGSGFGTRGRDAAFADLAARYPGLPREILRAVFRRHGLLAPQVLGEARAAADLGEDFGAGFTERELRYLVEREWARSVDDVLWRRTKAGLHLGVRGRERVARAMGDA
jgi:glycerol-3-phosphate dehydrogenase